jgi:hypothetical protein
LSEQCLRYLGARRVPGAEKQNAQGTH